MKDWQYALATWMLAALGLALASQNHPGYALPCVILALIGTFKLVSQKGKT
jgi:hypothetical protein